MIYIVKEVIEVDELKKVNIYYAGEWELEQGKAELSCATVQL